MIILDAKTDYSFMRGFGTAQQWLDRCKEIGVKHFCIADYCSTWGHQIFRKVFAKSDVHLMYGVQLPVVAHLDKDPRFSLVTLIATSDLAPLYELVSKAYEQSYYRPRVTWAQIKDFPGVKVLDLVLPHHMKHAAETKGAFLGVNPSTPSHMLKLKHKAVPAYTPRYPSPEVRQGYKLFQAISEGARIGEESSDALHMLRQSEFKVVYDQIAFDQKALDKIAKTCIADIPKGTLIVPKVYKNKRKQLLAMAVAGAKELGLFDVDYDQVPCGLEAWKPGYEERLNRELDVIEGKKFEDYFFFVADIVTWAKKRMFVGPGRGSAGGSLLCYCLGITSVDPIKFNTMFERFLDITRNDWPDIDIDFPHNRREEVFEYLRETYGEERVARLGTISEFGAKSAMNDTAKATGVPYDVAREFGKYTEGVGQGVTISPGRIFGTDKHDTMLTDDHYKLLEKYPQMRLATMLNWDDGPVNVGRPRHHGVHAAGVVVTQGKVRDFGATTKEGTICMDMKAAEDIGLVKMDALGLRTLSILQDACDMIGIDPRTLYDIDWEDTKVYEEIFNKDRVTGIFQFEGPAVRSLLKGLGKMERFDDVCALTSLARPGPLIGGAAENWVKARKGDIEPRDLHPSLEPTFGVICYQEQMMHIARDLAGFDEPNVNGMRRAVGKKDIAKLKGFRGAFIAGVMANPKWGVTVDGDTTSCLSHDDRQENAEALWDELCEFGSYAFNLAHAVAYGMISFMCAWLKLNYPLQFSAACLKHAQDDEQGKNLLRELKEEGFDYVPFDAEKSEATWSVQDGKLYGGFDSVRGIGIKTAQILVDKRKADPKNWQEDLTVAQRNKLIAEHNTPWHTLTFFTDNYKALYDDPLNFKASYAPNGFKGPIHRIRDIPEEKGNYAFLARITRVLKRDGNEDSRVAKRDGKKYENNTFFFNLQFEDDTGECGGTINRFKAGDFQWVHEESMEDRVFFVRGNIINEGSRWIFVDNLVELKQETKK